MLVPLSIHFNRSCAVMGTVVYPSTRHIALLFTLSRSLLDATFSGSSFLLLLRCSIILAPSTLLLSSALHFFLLRSFSSLFTFLALFLLLFLSCSIVPDRSIPLFCSVCLDRSLLFLYLTFALFLYFFFFSSFLSSLFLPPFFRTLSIFFHLQCHLHLQGALQTTASV